MSNESIKIAVTDGAMSANYTIRKYGRWYVHIKRISNNPYDRKMRKKEHVAWHNAFYETRKRSAYKRLL